MTLEDGRGLQLVVPYLDLELGRNTAVEVQKYTQLARSRIKVVNPNLRPIPL